MTAGRGVTSGIRAGIGIGTVERAGTGTVERAGTGTVERAGTGTVGRAGTGTVERAGTGTVERAGIGTVDGTDWEAGTTAGEGTTSGIGTGIGRAWSRGASGVAVAWSFISGGPPADSRGRGSANRLRVRLTMSLVSSAATRGSIATGTGRCSGARGLSYPTRWLDATLTGSGSRRLGNI
jgi:hypothetical protein